MDTAVNAPLGIAIFSAGGLAGALFYLPFKKVKGWAWESYWLIYAVAGLLVLPWGVALAVSPNTLAVIAAAPGGELMYCFLCGAAWGVGGLSWGLMIRHLGVGLGLAMGCGITSAAGTLIPPLLNSGNTIASMFSTASGRVSVASALISIVGIVFVGLAGMSKEGELSEAEKKKAVAEFNFRKGLALALFAGLMSSAMSFGLQGGSAIQQLALTAAPATSLTWAGMPVLVVVLSGGFVVNAAWCLYLNLRNRTIGDYARPSAPVWPNLAFAALAGVLWCLPMIGFKVGEPMMGATSYIGWAVMTGSLIFFSQLLGVALGEWKGTSRKTAVRLDLGLLLLVISTGLAGYGPTLD